MPEHVDDRVASPATGLSAADVAQRTAEGLTNDVPVRASRSVWDIVKANVLTRINAIFFLLFLIVLSTGYFLDGMFAWVIIANSVVGTIQEVRAKRTLDELAIIGQAMPRVRRDGVAAELPPSEVVLDDVIELGSGDQVVVDGVVVEAEALEIDESLLTGESDPVAKAPGDPVMSGSFVVAGAGACQATRVGREAYAAKLAEEASKFSLVKSELRSGIDRILKFITYLLVPAGALSIYNQLVVSDQAWNDTLRSMVAALYPMVPEGLVLMTSVAFAIGVIRLGRRKCLVNELPAIEGLARVDTVCADKTGTLTENAMVLEEVRELPGETVAPQALAALSVAESRHNASLEAIAEQYPGDPGWQVSAVAPFSSARKWSGASFVEHGNWVLGAPDVLLPAGSPAREEAEEIGSRGLRVLLLGRVEDPVDAPGAPGEVRPAALVVLRQKIRPDAKETLDYFAGQGVTVKVISGDNAVSVGAVADSLGLADAGNAVDARTLPEEPAELAAAMEQGTVFGRVTPTQKRAMVAALQTNGHTVAMTGDGVNDVLALKDADIGVAMGSGSPATRSVARIVLLDNKFATLPHVVGEGRRVIGNIERVSNLFLTKTVYSVLLALLIGIAQVPYPFLPRHLAIPAVLTIGVPAFILSLAPNNELARSGFVGRVLRLAIPSGVVVAVATFCSYLFVYDGSAAGPQETMRVGTTALITLIAIGFWVLSIIARPYTWWKVGLLAAIVALLVTVFLVPLGQRIFQLDPSNLAYTGQALGVALAGIIVVELFWWVDGRLRGEPRRLVARA